VFRNGRHIDTFPQGARTDAELVEMMIGREITAHFPPRRPPPRVDPVLEVRDLRWEDRLNGVSLTVGRGEIVGLGGLDGQGQKEMLLGLFGVLRGLRGDVLLDGAPARPGSPAAARSGAVGMALIPEDRKTEGLMLPMSIADNLVAASLDDLSVGPFLNRPRIEQAVREGMDALRIKAGAVEDPVSTLSGGNQQKVVIAKWLMTKPKVVLLNDPTRGIDVGTKQEIYRLLRRLAEEGVAILLYSTDYEELIGCCDRVAVMYDGRIARTLEGEAITEKAIVASALNMEIAADD
jgi:ribose transport system ATP-binding protein